MIIFEIKSILNRRIRLTQIQWFHIIFHHPELKKERRKIFETLIKPNLVLYDKDKGTYNYYRKFKKTPISDKFMHVIVKHLNKEGFIITSYFTDKIMRFERVVVYEKYNNEL